MPLRTAIYAAPNASDPQCESQLRKLREYAAGQGWVVFREYVELDSGRSGSPPLRPSRGQLRKDAYSSFFDIICVWQLEHWNCGSVAASVATIHEFLARRLRFIAVADQIDLKPSNRHWQIVLPTLLACAAWERQGRQRGVPVQDKGVRGRGRQRKSLDAAKLRQLSSRGHSVREIATELGASRSVVHRALQSMRLERPQ